MSDVDLRGIFGLPTRLALATAYPAVLSWVLLFAVLPIAILLGAFAIEPQLAAGIIPLCGFLTLSLWSIGYYQYTTTHVEMDSTTRILRAVQGDDSGIVGRREFTIQLNAVVSASVHSFGDVALIRVSGGRSGLVDRFTTPSSVIVSRENLPEILANIRRAGVEISESPADSGAQFFGPGTRLAITGLVFVLVPMVAIVAFGSAVLISNGTITVLLLGTLALGEEIWKGLSC
ncbi:hypothetical protein [Halorhabdus amylolytica]|uniref:hypothetical protein n=1 Tax=Halorhabdus amylolytica TaxID=2559573 RepID=UPI0010A9A6B2|nr:hypothetical protein [Halorhabdus amylolytica]